MEYVESYLPYLTTAHEAEEEQYTYSQYLEKQIAEVIKMYQEDGYNTNLAFNLLSGMGSHNWYHLLASSAEKKN